MVQPDGVGLGGYGYAPVVSFVPSLITTVGGTVHTGKVGVLSNAQNLALSGDTLLIADTGNGKIYTMDSSGTLATTLSGATTPLGIAADNFGNIFFDNGAATGMMYEIYNYATFDVAASGTGNDTCNISTPCVLSSEQLYYPGMLSIDPYNHLFFANEDGGAAMSSLQPSPTTFINLYSPFTYQESTLPDAFAVDASDNLYSLWAINTICEIQQQSLFNAENSNVIFTKVVGGRACGFSGDGGLATNAEIGAKVGQIAFDLAGNMYFSDTSNQRVRRVDAATGIIRTIAGVGTAGYTGDGARSTIAQLSYPTGVGVDTQGQVYIISGTGTTSGGAQVVRKVESTGLLSFPNTVQGKPSAALTVLISNTGNSSLSVTSTYITGTNPSDFTLDPTTTSCNFSQPIYAGQSCTVGIIFNPTATASRHANFVLLDNSSQMSNTINLVGVGVAPSVAQFSTPTANTEFAAGSNVGVTAYVSSSGSPAPTGAVTFRVDGSQVGGEVSLVSGSASTSLAGLKTGKHTITVVYRGDHYNGPATASESIIVSSANPIIIRNPYDPANSTGSAKSVASALSTK